MHFLALLFMNHRIIEVGKDL